MNRGDASWFRALLPFLIIVGAVAIGYAFNIFVGLAVAVVGLAIWLSRRLQRSRPAEPGE